MKKTLGLAAAAAAILLLTSCSPIAAEPDNAANPLGKSTASAKPKPTPTETEAPAPVEPLAFNASGLLFSTANPTLPAGNPDEVSVVQIGPLDDTGYGGTLLFAFRNNTREGIGHVDWSATARMGGSIVATGSSQGTIPAFVQPGEVGLGYIYFTDASAIGEGVEYEFQVDTMPAKPSPFNTAPMTVTEANLVGDTVVGGAVNKTGKKTSGPYSVHAYCFDGDSLVDYHGSFTEQDVIAPDATGSFSVTMYDANCPSFAVGVSGWFD